MIVHFNTNIKNAILEVIRSAINAGAAGGTCKIYTGVMPASPETALSGNTLLGTLTFAVDCGTVSGGVLTMAAITEDVSADNPGTATWARCADSNGVAVKDIDVSTTLGTGALKLNTTTIAAGGPIQISTFAISVP